MKKLLAGILAATAVLGAGTGAVYATTPDKTVERVAKEEVGERGGNPEGLQAGNPDKAEGERPDGTQGGNPDKAKGERPDGTQGGNPDKAKGERPDGTQGGNPDQAQGERLEGERPVHAEGETPEGRIHNVEKEVK